MTHASILGPPRFNKKLVSVEEALAQASAGQLETIPPPRQSARSQGSQGVPAWKIEIPKATPTSSYFIAPGRFNLGTIKRKNGDFIFYDLELPMGFWKELTLYRDLMKGRKSSLAVWAKVTAQSAPDGVMPADIRYGLAKVCYLNKDRTGLKSIIRDIRRDIICQDTNQTLGPHNSTLIANRVNEIPLVIPGYGWPEGHPFNVSYRAQITKEQAGWKNILTPDPWTNRVLESLLGETDPNECQTVIAFFTQPLVSLLGFEDYQIGMYGVGLRSTARGEFNFKIQSSDHRPARAVRADPVHYERR